MKWFTQSINYRLKSNFGLISYLAHAAVDNVPENSNDYSAVYEKTLAIENALNNIIDDLQHFAKERKMV